MAQPMLVQGLLTNLSLSSTPLPWKDAAFAV